MLLVAVVVLDAFQRLRISHPTIGRGLSHCVCLAWSPCALSDSGRSKFCELGHVHKDTLSAMRKPRCDSSEKSDKQNKLRRIKNMLCQPSISSVTATSDGARSPNPPHQGCSSVLHSQTSLNVRTPAQQRSGMAAHGLNACRQHMLQIPWRDAEAGASMRHGGSPGAYLSTSRGRRRTRRWDPASAATRRSCRSASRSRWQSARGCRGRRCARRRPRRRPEHLLARNAQSIR